MSQSQQKQDDPDTEPIEKTDSVPGHAHILWVSDVGTSLKDLLPFGVWGKELFGIEFRGVKSVVGGRLVWDREGKLGDE